MIVNIVSKLLPTSFKHYLETKNILTVSKIMISSPRFYKNINSGVMKYAVHDNKVNKVIVIIKCRNHCVSRRSRRLLEPPYPLGRFGHYDFLKG